MHASPVGSLRGRIAKRRQCHSFDCLMFMKIVNIETGVAPVALLKPDAILAGIK